MSKIDSKELSIAIKNIIRRRQLATHVETVELVVKLKNYTPKDKRFNGSVKLQYPVRKTNKVCIIGNKKDYDQCVKDKLRNVMSLDDLKKFKGKNRKDRDKNCKKFAKEYDGFVASNSVLAKITRALGPGLSKAGKFPLVVGPGETFKGKIDEIGKTVKFQFKKEVNLGVPIGHINLTEKQLATNVTTSLNFLASLLKKNWQSIGSATIKSTHGKPQRIWPAGNVVKQSVRLQRKKTKKKTKS
jgi:large subunit ribosomal protein L10Ae